MNLEAYAARVMRRCDELAECTDEPGRITRLYGTPALARANDNQIVALYRYNQARADLAHATGQMQNLYAK